MDKNRGKKNLKPLSADERTAPAMEMTKQKRTAVGIALLLAVVTAIAYSGALRNDFVYYDDNVYMTENARVQQGLSWDNVGWAFTTLDAVNWHPLTWLSHMLDVQLFGLNPAGHHFSNLLFHVLAALLLFGFLRYATGTLWTGAFVAALFALHPLHVESVAWVAERKDVLSALFWFATLWAYAYYARRPGRGRYALVAVLFALGLMAKPMLVTLPLVLFLLDYWPLERLAMNKRSFARLAAEKLPLLVMTAASAIITIIAQHEAIAGINRFSLAARISNAVVSYCIYIGQSLWPTGLAVFYPYPQQQLIITTAACALLLVAITAAVVRTGRHKKYLVTGWLWYLITLIPVIGIVQVGNQAHADRYTYIPLIGIFIMIAWGINAIEEQLHNGKGLLVRTAAAVALPAMAVMTWVQVGYWKNDFTLFSHAVAVTKNNYIAYNNLGFFYERSERADEAMACYRKALDISPVYGDAHYNLANMLLQTGRTDEAIAHYRKSLEINPDNIGALNNLAGAFVRKGQLTDAIPFVQRALTLAKSAGDERRAREIAINLEKLYQATRSFQEKQR